jgi:mannose-6-phosphate isomerase-like protein (cupin superfamily)
MALTNGTTNAYTIAVREQALNFMADYPGYGEQRWYSEALATEQVSFSWRKMPPHTGGRGSYGHRHPSQEEVYFVILGTVTFKVDDEVFEAEAQTAVRIGGDAYRSVHNDTDEEAELLIFSTRLLQPPLEKQDGFWS